MKGVSWPAVGGPAGQRRAARAAEAAGARRDRPLGGVPLPRPGGGRPGGGAPDECARLPGDRRGGR